MKTAFLSLVWLTLACSSGTDEGEKPTLNSCATPGSTYVARYTRTGGDCPAQIPDQVVNIPSDGSLPLKEGESCRLFEQEGCTGRGTDCTSESDGCTNTQTFSTTFTEDGSSAVTTSSMKIRCSNGSGCNGTYRIDIERQD